MVLGKCRVAKNMDFEMVKCPRDPCSKVVSDNKKTGNEFGVFQGLNFLLTGLRLHFHLSHRKSK